MWPLRCEAAHETAEPSSREMEQADAWAAEAGTCEAAQQQQSVPTVGGARRDLPGFSLGRVGGSGRPLCRR